MIDDCLVRLTGVFKQQMKGKHERKYIHAQTLVNVSSSVSCSLCACLFLKFPQSSVSYLFVCLVSLPLLFLSLPTAYAKASAALATRFLSLFVRRINSPPPQKNSQPPPLIHIRPSSTTPQIPIPPTPPHPPQHSLIRRPLAQILRLGRGLRSLHPSPPAPPARLTMHQHRHRLRLDQPMLPRLPSPPLLHQRPQRFHRPHRPHPLPPPQRRLPLHHRHSLAPCPNRRRRLVGLDDQVIEIPHARGQRQAFGFGVLDGGGCGGEVVAFPEARDARLRRGYADVEADEGAVWLVVWNDVLVVVCCACVSFGGGLTGS